MLVHDPWRAAARSYPWRAGARLAAVIALLCLCAGGSLARPAPEAQPARLPPADLPIALPPAPLKLAALEQADRPMTRQARQPRQRGPFGLSAAEDSPYARRWRTLQPLMRLERLVLAACRATAAPCPAAATKFNAIIEAGRSRSGRARVGEINRAINLAIRPMSDMAQYGAPDIWSTPLATFATGAGDCEDYAIAKYVALSEAGVPASDLRLVLVHDNAVDQGHMVAAARVEGRWLILDNRTMRLVADGEVVHLTPLVALGGEEPAAAIAAGPKPELKPEPNPEPKPAKAPAEARDMDGLPVVL